MGQGPKPTRRTSYTTKGGVGATFNEAARRVQNRIRGLKKEQGYFLNENGDVLHKIKGKGNEVAIPKEVTNDIEDRILYGKQKIGFIHNHPDGGTFSAEDVWTMTKRGITEYRATSKDGTYVLKTESGGPMYDMRFATGAQDAYTKAWDEADKASKAEASTRTFKNYQERAEWRAAYETKYIQSAMDRYYRENAKKYKLIYQHIAN